MNNHLSLHRDTVDEALKADALEQRMLHIDDDGFTLRVMDALPQKKTSFCSDAVCDSVRLHTDCLHRCVGIYASGKLHF